VDGSVPSCSERWLSSSRTSANGAWLKATPIPADRSNYGVDTIIEETVNKRTEELIRNAGKSADPEGLKVGHKVESGPNADIKPGNALALKNIQQELAKQKLSLKMFDCYRPARAVADMVAWSRDGKETSAQKRYNPAFSKADLFRLGYIATHSGHSTGAALDLTLVDLKADNSVVFDPAKDYGDCTANVNLRAPDGSVDMGTGYDCSDVKSHTAAKSITAAQRRWREKLVLVMARRGFVNYSKEWWHFSLPGAGGQAYDFPITPRK